MESKKLIDVFEIDEISDVSNQEDEKKRIEQSESNKLLSSENVAFTYDVVRRRK